MSGSNSGSGVGIQPVAQQLPAAYTSPVDAATFNNAMAIIQQAFNLSNVNKPYILKHFFSGTYSNSQTLDVGFFGVDVTFPQNMGQSVGGCLLHPSSAATLRVEQNGTVMATMSITTGGVMTFSKQGPFTYRGNTDLYSIVAQASADATFGSVYFSLRGIST